MSVFPVSGKEMPVINLREVTIGELDDLRDPRQPASEAHAILAKAAGMSVEEVRALKVHDYRALAASLFQASYNPLAPENDPNS